MGIVEELRQVNRSTAVALAIFFLAFVAPGCLVVFYFRNDLFLSLDTVKLVLLGSAICSPPFFIPYFFSAVTSSTLVHRRHIAPGAFGDGVQWYYRYATNSSINLYLTLLLCYLFRWPFLYFVWLNIAATVVVLVGILLKIGKVIRDPEAEVPINPA